MTNFEVSKRKAVSPCVRELSCTETNKRQSVGLTAVIGECQVRLIATEPAIRTQTDEGFYLRRSTGFAKRSANQKSRNCQLRGALTSKREIEKNRAKRAQIDWTFFCRMCLFGTRYDHPDQRSQIFPNPRKQPKLSYKVGSRIEGEMFGGFRGK